MEFARTKAHMPLVHVPAIPEQRLDDLTQTFPGHKQGFPNCRGPIAKFLRSKKIHSFGQRTAVFGNAQADRT